jgi:TolA-binding protein
MKRALFAILMLILALPAAPAMSSGNPLVDHLYARVDSWPGQPTQPGQPTLPPVNPIPPTVPGNPGYPGYPGNGNYESADYLFNTGRTAFTQGNFYNAVQYLRRFIDRYPYEYRAAEAHYLVAEAYRRLNDFYNAVSFYRKVSTNFANFSEAHRAAYFVGFCLVKITDYYGAISEFKNFIGRFPTSELVDDAWYVVGKTYEQVNDRANAIMAYQQVVYNYSNSNFYNQALERLNYLQNGGVIYPTPPTYPPNNPIPPTYPGNGSYVSDYELYQRGHSELISGNFQNALTYFDELIKRYPTSAYADDAYYWKGDAWRQQRNYLRAIPEFESLMRLYPGSELYAPAVYAMAGCEFEYGRINAANRSYLSRAASHYAWYQQNYPAGQYAADALVQAGDCYELLGDYSQARYCYQQTIDLYPNSAAAIKAKDKINGYW